MKKLILSLAFAAVAVSLQAGESKTLEKGKDVSCCTMSPAAGCSGKSAAAGNGSKIVMSPKAAEQVRKS